MSLWLAPHSSSESDQSLRISPQHWYEPTASTLRNTWWSPIGIEPSASHAAGTHAHRRQRQHWRSAQSRVSQSQPAVARVSALACARQPCAALCCSMPCLHRSYSTTTCHSSRSRVCRTAPLRSTVDRCGPTASCESGPHPPAHRRHQCVVRGESHLQTAFVPHSTRSGSHDPS